MGMLSLSLSRARLYVYVHVCVGLPFIVAASADTAPSVSTPCSLERRQFSAGVTSPSGHKCMFRTYENNRQTAGSLVDTMRGEVVNANYIALRRCGKSA